MTVLHDQDIVSFLSDELLAQVDDSELSKFAVISVVIFFRICSMLTS